MALAPSWCTIVMDFPAIYSHSTRHWSDSNNQVLTSPVSAYFMQSSIEYIGNVRLLFNRSSVIIIYSAEEVFSSMPRLLLRYCVDGNWQGIFISRLCFLWMAIHRDKLKMNHTNIVTTIISMSALLMETELDQSLHFRGRESRCHPCKAVSRKLATSVSSAATNHWFYVNLIAIAF